MARLSDFIPQAQIDAHLDGDPDIVQGKLELAEDVVEYARSISPEDEGTYKDGIVARRHGTGVGIYWTDPKSNIIENGTIDTPEFAVYRRTIEHFQNR